MSRRQQMADAPGVDLQEAEAGLKSILDLMAGWREKYGMGYVTAFILPDGSGRMRTRGDAGCEAYGQYPPMEAGGEGKAPTAAAAKAQETKNEITPLA